MFKIKIIITLLLLAGVAGGFAYVQKLRADNAANRCIEIASGAELTEAEKNATKKSEINTECPSIANPNYIPY